MKNPIFRCSFIGLGSNISKRDKTPPLLLRQMAAALESTGFKILSASALYLTEPIGGGGRQPLYCNAVIKVNMHLSPGRLLHLAKALERSAGRRRGRRNGPRPIDIDILDFGGRITGRASSQARSTLVLPHPELHRRRFVLEPLLDVAPEWHHPRLNQSARQLLAGLPVRPGAVQRIVDSDWLSCDEERLCRVWAASAAGSSGASRFLSTLRRRPRLLPARLLPVESDTSEN